MLYLLSSAQAKETARWRTAYRDKNCLTFVYVHTLSCLLLSPNTRPCPIRASPHCLVCLVCAPFKRVPRSISEGGVEPSSLTRLVLPAFPLVSARVMKEPTALWRILGTKQYDHVSSRGCCSRKDLRSGEGRWMVEHHRRKSSHDIIKRKI